MHQIAAKMPSTCWQLFHECWFCECLWLTSHACCHPPFFLLQAEIMNGRWALLGAMGCLVPELLVRNNVSGNSSSLTAFVSELNRPSLRSMRLDWCYCQT